MERKELNISYTKSGSGSITSRLSIPISWLKKMGVTQEDRKVEVVFEDNEIRIKKLD